jgi:hypothetical protein
MSMLELDTRASCRRRGGVGLALEHLLVDEQEEVEHRHQPFLLGINAAGTRKADPLPPTDTVAGWDDAMRDVKPGQGLIDGLRETQDGACVHRQ